MKSLIIGAGPAGLAAAHELAVNGAGSVVSESQNAVGGLCRTMLFEDCRFDVGPHRFFTRNEEVRQLFDDIVADDLINVPRLTRIYYNGKYFDYPLTAKNALFTLGTANAVQIVLSYIACTCSNKSKNAVTFEDWVVGQFGRRLFEIFFKTYTEKVWGIDCSRIGAEWAGQRIKGLNLFTAALNALVGDKKKKIKTLVDEFVYPRLGAGQFYEKMADKVTSLGSEIMLNSQVVRLKRDGNRIVSAVLLQGGNEVEVEADNFFSSMPLTDLIDIISPAPPQVIMDACAKLRYRDHMSVQLKYAGHPFPDNWIYVHAREVGMARICDYRNFSRQMTSDDNISPLTVEYFTFKEGPLWGKPDDELIAMAAKEMETMNVASANNVVNGYVVRSEKAYPLIELGYDNHVETLKSWLSNIANLTPIGRAGMFKYNNQDHAIATGMLAARNAMGIGKFDPWKVNIDAEYHEGGKI
jgi:protoporphyrinogen oxidase